MIRIIFKNLTAYALLLILLSFGSNQISGQTTIKPGPPVPVTFCIDADEMALYHMINDYRKRYSLPPIPLSKSLSYVAAMHAKDLFLHNPDQGACNFHSWSNKGFWKPFCYPKDETKKNSVWDKPRELTKYPSKAYEIVYWENNPLVLDTIIMVWKTEDYFNSFLLNNGKWQGKTWNAIGIAVYENYACAWFGEVPDAEGDAIVCGSKPADTQPELSVDTLAIVTQTVTAPKDSLSGIYYIIVKTNVPREAAKKLVSNLTSEYPAAKVLEYDGKIRVSILESLDKPTIQVKLKEVKKTYKDAWLLKR